MKLPAIDFERFEGGECVAGPIAVGIPEIEPEQPGEPADVVALGGNPLEDLNAYGRVRFVMRAGRRVR